MPEGGEWWGKADDSGERVFFIGRDPGGQLVWMGGPYSHHRRSYQSGDFDWSGWVHLEGCTDWDWVPDEVVQPPAKSDPVVYNNLKSLDEILEKFPCPEGYEYQRSCPYRDGIDQLNFYYPEQGKISGWIEYNGGLKFTTGMVCHSGSICLLRCKTEDRPVVETSEE